MNCFNSSDYQQGAIAESSGQQQHTTIVSTLPKSKKKKKLLFCLSFMFLSLMR